MEPLEEIRTESKPQIEAPSRVVYPFRPLPGHARSLGALVTSTFSIVLGGIAISGAFGEKGFWVMLMSLGLMAAAAALTPDRSPEGLGAAEPARLRLITSSKPTLGRVESNRASG